MIPNTKNRTFSDKNTFFFGFKIFINLHHQVTLIHTHTHMSWIVTKNDKDVKYINSYLKKRKKKN